MNAQLSLKKKTVRSVKTNVGKGAKLFFSFALFFVFMIPFFLVIMNAAKTASEISLNPTTWPTNWGQMFTNIVNVINNPNFSYLNAFADSVIITVVSLLMILISSSMAAWVLVRNKTWWSSLIFLTLVASMTIPFQVVMLPLVRWLHIMTVSTGIRFNGTVFGIVFCYMGFGASLSMFVFHGFIKNIPLELEEAADIDGCPRSQVFFRIVLPMLQPTAVTVMILNGIWIWNDYLLPLMVLGASGSVQTLPLAVSAFAGAFLKQWDLILTSALLAMLPIIILFIIAQKYIIKGMIEGSIK